jgi:hypothetical protein
LNHLRVIENRPELVDGFFTVTLSGIEM